MDGSSAARTFVDRLRAEALDSSAANHPYLDALRGGDLPDITLAFRDFALQYGIYSANFTRYLGAVIPRLESDAHKRILISNLDEEQGDAHEAELPPDVMASIAGEPHAALFRRFQRALGVSPPSTPDCDEHAPGLRWSQALLELCETDQWAGIGALGIGTELIVSKIYNQVLAGLKAHSTLTLRQRVFFDLHSSCDDEHAAQLLIITRELARDDEARERITHGVLETLRLRTEFWDSMLTRARGFAAAGAESAGLAKVGH